MNMPIAFSDKPVEPTGFDFTRRDSLKVHIRDFSTTLKETINWLKTKPFE